MNEFLVVGDGILISYKGNNSKKVLIPENVKKIGANVFECHSEIVSVYIPDNVEEVGEEAFKDCTSLISVSGGKYVKKISDRAFLNCPLETISISAFLESIGLRAFDQENGGKSDCVVFLGNTLPTISCEKTAARYTNGEYRKNALSSVEVAVVNNVVTDFEGTILDDENMFHIAFLSFEEQFESFILHYNIPFPKKQELFSCSRTNRAFSHPSEGAKKRGRAECPAHSKQRPL